IKPIHSASTSNQLGSFTGEYSHCNSSAYNFQYLDHADSTCPDCTNHIYNRPVWYPDPDPDPPANASLGVSISKRSTCFSDGNMASISNSSNLDLPSVPNTGSNKNDVCFPSE